MTGIIRSACFITLLTFSSSRMLAQHKEVSIRIAQDESVMLDSAEKHLVLQRKPFKIHVLLENVEGVYCFASFSDTLYRLADTDAIPGLADLPARLLDEEDFNKEKEIYVSNDGWGYWFYKAPPAAHKFNRKVVLLDGDRLVVTKSIKQIYNTSTRKETKLKEIVAPLYLVLVAVETDANGKPVKELIRRRIPIDWIDEEPEKWYR